MLMMSAGLTAGLVVSLALRFVWAGVARASGSLHASMPWRDAGVINELLYVVGHCLLGAGVGLVFWLSWGFTALVDLNWWQRGMVFGLIVAVVFGSLPLLLMRSLLRVPAAINWFWLCEMTALGVIAGLNCSWHWQSIL